VACSCHLASFAWANRQRSVSQDAVARVASGVAGHAGKLGTAPGIDPHHGSERLDSPARGARSLIGASALFVATRIGVTVPDVSLAA
jgi:hypothetical protein